MEEKAKVIKCLAYYDTLDSTDNRMNNPAAFTKSTYLFNCLERLGYKVEILSASYVLGQKSAKGTTQKLSDNVTLTKIDSMGRGCKVKNILGGVIFTRKVRKALDFFVQEGDTLFVYHSLGYINTVKKLKKKKDFKLLLEVEEIYGHVIGSEEAVKRETDLFTYADGYIFCTDLLEKAVNISAKPYTIVHGTYKTEGICDNSSDDGIIHCVYAGTLDPRKGALNAVNAARFLDERYHIHILGYGSDEEIAIIKDAVADASSSCGAKVTYDGILSGKEYTDFLGRCSVGLCTQEITASFNNTSFPSKVLVYMANGLRVVSVCIPAIENSDVGEYLYFYKDSTPEAVAKAIKSIDFTEPYNGREIISKLDKKFLSELDILLKSI